MTINSHDTTVDLKFDDKMCIRDRFYLMMDDSLYRINLGSMSVKKVVEGLSTGSYCASELSLIHISQALSS